MGCRLVAFITIIVIICLELGINIIASPANYATRNNVEIPIHKRKLKTGESVTFSSDLEQKSVFTFQADVGQKLSIKFEEIGIDFPREDVINVYSGVPQQVSSSIEKSKTTEVQSTITQAEFKLQTKRMPLLISSKSVKDTIQDVLIRTDHFYKADANELTVLFDHSSNGHFTAMVEASPAKIKNTAGSGGSLTRNLRDPNEQNSVQYETGSSFALCGNLAQKSVDSKKCCQFKFRNNSVSS